MIDKLELWIYVEPTGKVPTIGKSGDAGLDCYADLSNLNPYTNLELLVGQVAKIPLGFHYAFKIRQINSDGYPSSRVRDTNDYYIEIANRSGFGTKEVVTELARICDASYRGIPHYSIAKIGGTVTTITHHQKVCQALIHPFVDPYKINIVLVNSLEELGTTDRGSGGFGSTGTT
jgi:dUTPase